ncbi:MAG: hypothetical protein HYU04_00965 [Candidatus Wildermuthbacteria bacterium]|nr:hypothetical protein [Candidatus Wildermuthbacteria bacterium]
MRYRNHWTPREMYYWKRQERFGTIGGILFALLGTAFGAWAGISSESNPIGTILGMLIVGFLGFWIGALMGGILSIPPEDVVESSKNKQLF